jgi:MraZ protein
MFLGTFENRLDEHSRVMLPFKLRDEIDKNSLYLAPGQSKCLSVFSYAQYQEYKKNILDNPPSNVPLPVFKRVFFSSMSKQNLDKQGRLSIAKNLKDYAALKKDLTIIGLEDRLEIWDTNEWQKYIQKYNNVLDTIKEDL